jgi:hypothetical protein
MISNENYATIHFYQIPPNDVDREKSPSNSLSNMIIASSVHCRRIELNSEVEDDGNDENNTQEEGYDTNWHIPFSSQANIRFSTSQGINIHHSKFFDYTKPRRFIFFLLRMKYFKLFRIKQIYMLHK